MVNLDELQALYERWKMPGEDAEIRGIAGGLFWTEVSEAWPTLRAELLEARQLLREAKECGDIFLPLQLLERIDAWEAKWTA
jgi:hypothetical protein